MNLHHLFVFCSVAKNKSFKKAANEINISQPAISQQIQKLEQALEKKLIERKGVYFKLTSHGETLYEYGKRIFELTDEAKTALSTLSSYQQSLFIGTTAIPGTSFLLDIIEQSMEKNHYLKFNIITESTTNKLIDKIIKNQIDVAIAYESIILRDDIIVRKIAHDELVLALPGKHPWANGRMVSFEDILTLPFIFLNEDSFIQQILNNVLSGRKINVILNFKSIDIVKSAIIRGLGVSLLPYSTIKYELENGLLSVANCNIFRIPRDVVILYKERKKLPESVKIFLENSNLTENNA